MSRTPGEDDDLDEMLPLGEMLAMFKLGYTHPHDKEQEAQWLRHCLRRQAQRDREALLESATIRKLLESATLEQRACKLCGKQIRLVGPRPTPFDDDGRFHGDTCSRTKE